jgi:LacI family transcriptional regulator
LATIKDVARAVGVSTTTVSNVIHGSVGRVSPEMVAKIEAAIARLQYVPNMSARALVNNASRIIGVINHLVPSKSGGFLQDPFHGALLAGIEQTLRERGYYLMVRTIDSVPELLSLLNNWNLDGLILTGIFPTDFYESLMAQKTPILLIDSYIQNDHVLQVRLQDQQGGYLGTRHLLENGHRNILFCGPPILEEGVLARRFKGYCQALQEYDLPVKMENVYQQEIGIEQGTALGRELAARRDYTAIFATADILAAGLISGLSEAGRNVPEDISIVGFDDLNIARLTSPQLTTIHQDVVEKGVIAARMLIDALQGQEDSARRVVLPVRLVSRQSVRRLGL